MEKDTLENPHLTKVILELHKLHIHFVIPNKVIKLHYRVKKFYILITKLHHRVTKFHLLITKLHLQITKIAIHIIKLYQLIVQISNQVTKIHHHTTKVPFLTTELHNIQISKRKHQLTKILQTTVKYVQTVLIVQILRKNLLESSLLRQRAEDKILRDWNQWAW